MEEITRAEALFKELRLGNNGSGYKMAVTEGNATGEVISAAAFNMVSGTNVFGTIATKTKLSSDFLYRAFECAFSSGAKRITSLVREDNLKSAKLVSGLGFTVEHRVFELWEEGKYVLMFSITKEKYLASELYTRLSKRRLKIIAPISAPKAKTTVILHGRIRKS
jgi:hypothetical protein